MELLETGALSPSTWIKWLLLDKYFQDEWSMKEVFKRSFSLHGSIIMQFTKQMTMKTLLLECVTRTKGYYCGK